MSPRALPMVNRPAWPSIAAAIATLLGMGSCALTVVPLTFLGAPIVALVLSALLFHRLLPLGSVAPTLELHEKRIGRAAWVAWLVTIGVTWVMSGWTDAQLVQAGLSPGSGAREVGVIGGVISGGILAAQVRSIGEKYWKAIHPTTPTREARDGG